MNMAVDMLFTEAVIARAAGTVTELQRRILRVGFSADGALVPIGHLCLFLFDPGGFPAEVYRFGRGACPSSAEDAGKLRPAEHKEVQNSHKRQQILREGTQQHFKEKQGCIQNGKPLDFHRNEEKQQNPHVGKQHGKGEEHGKIDIRGREISAAVAEEGHEHTVKNGEHSAGEIVQGEFGAAPVPFKGRADKVVEVQGKGDP